MRMKELNKEEYNDFIAKANKTSLYQTTEYGMAMAKYYRPLFVGLEINNQIVAGALILIKKRMGFDYGYCPRGFILDYNDLELLKIWSEELKKFLLKYNVIAVKLCPPIHDDIDNYQVVLKNMGYYHLGFNNYFEALKPRFEAVIDLNHDLEKLFYNIKKSYRTKIRSAANRGVKIYRGTIEDLTILHNQIRKKYPRDLEYFRDLYLQFNQNAQISIYYAKFDTCFYLEKIKNQFEEYEVKSDLINNQVLNNSENNLNLINKKMKLDQKVADLKSELIKANNINKARPEGINVASALVITHKTEVYLLIDGLDTEFKYLNGKHLLIWKIIEKYQQLGYKTFNLGGITNPNIENNKFSGLNDFKLGFNAKPIEYIGDFEIIINNAKYFMFSKSKPIKGILKR